MLKKVQAWLTPRADLRPVTLADLERFKMAITQDFQTAIDNLNTAVGELPTPESLTTAVTTAVANAEAAKDQDQADGLAALNTAITSFQTAAQGLASAVTAINQPTPQPQPSAGGQ